MRKSLKVNLATSIVIVLAIGLDQLIKYFVDLNLKPIGSKMLIPNFLQLRYFENDGAMMGMMSGKIEIMSIAALICLLVILIVLFSGKIKFGVMYCCIAGFIAGGVGNLIDRVFRGYVIDYIEVLFMDFYIFNFADSIITVCAFIMIGYQIYDIYRDSKLKKLANETEN